MTIPLAYYDRLFYLCEQLYAINNISVNSFEIVKLHNQLVIVYSYKESDCFKHKLGLAYNLICYNSAIFKAV